MNLKQIWFTEEGQCLCQKKEGEKREKGEAEPQK